eukprot:TRINITY_DN20199_c0_g2_i1.p1 TRINITY_DN20199_c0_g2~~TRINITY_DN20199_c0_g2_i1.p1  ORF type:complete len:123 (-),score=12.77 TRINITY_DN20199_c0_g2_i1:724-1092(-)
MHDFCFTLPYGTLLVLGGLFGFLRKGSVPSLVGGAGCGLLLCLAGYVQLQSYHKSRNNWPSIFLELFISTLLTIVLGKRFQDTGKFMPAGLIAALSILMSLFYIYKVLTKGNQFPAKKVTTD